jgi:putative methionine-R-sulfoxide reductase with GAF domain
MKDSELGKAFSDGDVICREGEKGEVMYVIQSGNVKITKKTTSGEVTLATLTSGDIFGEMALFDRMPRSATAVASGEVSILSIDKKKLFTTISRDPTLVFKVLETMSQRIRILDEELSRLKKTKEHLLQSCCDVEETCEMILQEAKKTISAENGSVMLCDNDNALSIKAAFGSKSTQLISLKVGEGIAGDVLMTGRSEMLNNVSTDGRYKKGSTKIISMLCAPLKCDNTVFGVINMSNTSERLFVLEDLRMLNSLAVYASIAVKNALNYAQLRVAADEVLKHAIRVT